MKMRDMMAHVLIRKLQQECAMSDSQQRRASNPVIFPGNPDPNASPLRRFEKAAARLAAVEPGWAGSLIEALENDGPQVGGGCPFSSDPS